MEKGRELDSLDSFTVMNLLPHELTIYDPDSTPDRIPSRDHGKVIQRIPPSGIIARISTETVEAHTMHAEFYRLPEATADAVNRARARGGRVVAVGTTAVRTLESAAGEDGRVRAGEGWTDIFIYPGYRFRVVDALVTNFHLPRSTLLMLVCAFAGRERVLSAYKTAVEAGYRFYSFGDAMLIL